MANRFGENSAIYDLSRVLSLANGAQTGLLPDSVTGTGTAPRLAQFSGPSTIEDSTLIKTGAGVLTLSSAGAYTLTVPETMISAGRNVANTFTTGPQSLKPAGTAGIALDANAATGDFTLSLSPANLTAARRVTFPDAALTVLGRDTNIAAGRVAFGSDANTLSGDAALVWDNVNKHLGVGVASPGYAFDASVVNTSVYRLAGSQFVTGTVSSFTIGSGGATGAARITSSTGYIQLTANKFGINIDTPSSTLHTLLNAATTNSVDEISRFTRNTTGTAANGLGGSIALNLESSTTADTAAAALKWLWVDATHASRKAKLQFSTYDTSERIGLAIEADGAAQDVYFEGGAGSGLPYGSCYGNEIGWSQAGAVQDTWYVISDADMADGHGGLNLVTHDGSGKLTVTKAGRYRVDYTVSQTNNGNNKHIQTGIAINGTVIGDGINHVDGLAANIDTMLGGNAIVALTAAQYVEIAIRTTDTGTPDISVDHLNITLVQVGG